MIWQLTDDIMISTSDNGRDMDGNISSDDKPADIFQVEGDYCLDCWQKRTYPNLEFTLFPL